MSRIGNKIITIPAGVTVEVLENNRTVVKGPKGELAFDFNPGLNINVEENKITITRPNDSKEMKTIHGTTRAVLNNMVVGVSEGFKKGLVISGVGYRASVKDNKIIVNAGYSHDVELEVPSSLKVEVNKNTEVTVSGIDKQEVGQFAALIRNIRRPEPYKGYGIRYATETIRRKEGKTAKK